MVKKSFFLLFTLFLLLFLISPFIMGLWIHAKINDNLSKFNEKHPNLILKKESFHLGFLSSSTNLQLSLKKPSQTQVRPSPKTLSLPIRYHVKIHHGPVVFINTPKGKEHWSFAPFIVHYKTNQIGFNTEGQIKGSFKNELLLSSKSKNIDIKFDFATLHLKKLFQKEHLTSSFNIKNAHGEIGEINIEINENDHSSLWAAKNLKYTTQLSPGTLFSQLNIPLFKIKDKNNKELLKTKSLTFNLKKFKNKEQKSHIHLMGKTRIAELTSQFPNAPLATQSLLATLDLNISNQALETLMHEMQLWLQNIVIKKQKLAYKKDINKQVISTFMAQGLGVNLNVTAKTIEKNKIKAQLTLSLPNGANSLLAAIIKIKANMGFSLPQIVIQQISQNQPEKEGVINQLINDKLIMLNDDHVVTSVVYKSGFFIINGMFYTYPQVLKLIKNLPSSYTKTDNSLFFPTKKP